MVVFDYVYVLLILCIFSFNLKVVPGPNKLVNRLINLSLLFEYAVLCLTISVNKTLLLLHTVLNLPNECPKLLENKNCKMQHVKSMVFFS